MSLITAFFVVMTVVIFTDLMVARSAFAHKNYLGVNLGQTCLCAGAVCLSYSLAILMKDYRLYSVFSSVYFICVDYMLLFLTATIRAFTEDESRGNRKSGFMVYACIVSALDTIVFLINPFSEIAVSYIPVSLNTFSWYAYDMHLPGVLHLAYSYILVLWCFVFLIKGQMKLPRIYRRSYLIILCGIGLVALLNAAYLFLPKDSLLTCFDFSICTYSMAAGLIYWCLFKFVPVVLPTHLKSVVVNTIDQGVVLFDYKGNIVLTNDKAKELLPAAVFEETPMMPERFKNICGIELSDESGVNGTTQCYPQNAYQNPLRCQCRRLLDDKKRYLGYLFVFSDASPKTDALTGFYTWDAYRRETEEGMIPVEADEITVAVCDINNLSEVNQKYGRSEGDRCIRSLAEAIRVFAPRKTYLLRGPETTLICICPDTDEEHAKRFMQSVEVRYKGPMQYAVCAVGKKVDSIDGAIAAANQAIRNKQLLDDSSVRSDFLSGLIRALQECDPDTESHVQRTRRAGMLLGRKLNLSDVDLSNLSLLCLLHDIGKIGIPLEILNKPGKLTDEEFATIRTHVNKGYEIAMASGEIRPLANMILHHHERWDGKGYPDKLEGENIPILSRVIAVVDAYDAMVSNRSYRNALPVEVARSEIRNNAGTQFDPVIATAFLALLEEEPELFEVKNQPPAYIREPSVMRTMKADAPDIRGGEVDTMLLPYSRYLLNGENKIIKVDEHFENLTGYSPEDVQALNLGQIDLIPEEDHEHYLQITGEQLAKHTRAFLQHQLKRRDGTVISVFCYGRQFYDSVSRTERAEIIVVRVDNR